MLVLVTYDVETLTPAGQKRLRKVARMCTNHGTRVQNSVFECVLDYAQYIKLKQDLSLIIDNTSDSIRFYVMGNNWKRHVDVIGLDNAVDVTGDLIL